jgi:hypothetical protein
VRIVGIVVKVGGDLDVLVIGVGTQPPVAFVPVLLAKGIGIEVEDLFNGPLPLSSARPSPLRWTNLK